jgi:hypothetical protein
MLMLIRELKLIKRPNPATIYGAEIVLFRRGIEVRVRSNNQPFSYAKRD